MATFRLAPTALPPTGKRRAAPHGSTLAREIAALGYPPLAHLRRRQPRVRNPGEVLLEALAQPQLEARLLEALPWLLVRYPEVDQAWLVREAKLHDLQNRLGFVVTLARRVAERDGRTPTAEMLSALEAELDRSRLAREDTLGRAAVSELERQWLRTHRSPEARHWNLVTDWTVEALRYGVE